MEDDGETGRPTTLDRMNPIDSPDSEPSIGATAAVNQTDRGGFVHHGEQDCELDTTDEEPSLGAPEQHMASILARDDAWRKRTGWLA